MSFVIHSFFSGVCSLAELLKEFEFLATKQLDKDSDEINAVVSPHVHWSSRVAGVVWCGVGLGCFVVSLAAVATHCNAVN